MKAITYIYRGIPHAFTLTTDDIESAQKLFFDIFSARDAKKETMLIYLPDGMKMITPVEIIDLTLGDLDSITTNK